MDNLAPQGTNWIILIAIFTASISLAGFTSRWIAAKIPSLSRFGFFLYLSTTTFYFCVITVLMQNLLQR
jgi:hypothetical protein